MTKVEIVELSLTLRVYRNLCALNWIRVHFGVHLLIGCVIVMQDQLDATTNLLTIS